MRGAYFAKSFSLGWTGFMNAALGLRFAAVFFAAMVCFSCWGLVDWLNYVVAVGVAGAVGAVNAAICA